MKNAIQTIETFVSRVSIVMKIVAKTTVSSNICTKVCNHTFGYT